MAYSKEINTVLHNSPTIIGVSKRGLGSFVGALYLMNIWKAFQVSKIDKAAKGGQQDTFWATVGGMIFPNWYSAFKIGKYVPNGNSVSHALGQVLIPSLYTSWQLAKLREQKLPQSSNGTFEKGLAFMVSQPYGAFAATTLANQASKLFPPKRPVFRPDTYGYQAIQPQNAQPLFFSQPIAVIPAQQPTALAQQAPYTVSPFRMNY